VLHSSGTVDNSPTAQLTKEEGELLRSLVATHRKGPYIDWDNVSTAWDIAVFQQQPDIYQRDKKRLQISLKNYLQTLQQKAAHMSSRNHASSTNILNISSSSSSSSSTGRSLSQPSTGQQSQLPASVLIGTGTGGTGMRSVLGAPMASSVALGSHATRQERTGDLTVDEHAVVKKVAEARYRQGLDMCHTAVMTEYHREFPNHTRSHQKLMAYWKTYKGGAAWRGVVAQIDKEKQQQRLQSEVAHK
jgi:hypothetical protein